MGKQRITQADWERHRTELKRLYLEEGKSLSKIRTEMNENHDFCPSKSQYETAFNKWNFRKNLSLSEWKFVEHRTKKRKADNKETEVYLGGTLISSKRIKKELGRLFPPTYRQSHSLSPSPQTPPDMAVRTPINPVTFEIRLDNLPWFQFQEEFESHGFGQDLVTRVFGEGVRQIRAMFDDLPAFPDTSGLIAPSDKQGSVESFMQAILLERNPGDFELSMQKLRGPFNCDALTEFLKYAAYLSSNNMLSTDQSDQFLRWVIKTNNHSTLEAFFLVKIPTIKAFARCIFESALQIMDATILRILLTAGVDPGPPIRFFGMTPLQVVVQRGSTELARILLDEGVDVNALSSNGLKTALTLAVQAASPEIVQMLLDEGADVNRASEMSALEAATRIHMPHTGTRIAQILLEAGADVESPVLYNPEKTALQAAAKRGNIELARLLLCAGADVNAMSSGSYEDRGTVLQMVASGNNHKLSIELAQLLLNAGVDVNAPASRSSRPQRTVLANTALKAAVESGSTAMIQMLLDAGADVDASASWMRYNALCVAASSGSVEIVQMLLDAGANVSARPHHDALQVAAKSGSVEIVRMLLDAGADVNSQPHGGLLTAATEGGNAEMVRMLLGTFVVANSQLGGALCAAAKRDSIELAQMLLDAGADVNSENPAPPIIAAANIGNTDLVKLFLAAGANVNATDGWNDTALNLAAGKNHSITAQVLLGAGADPNTSTFFRGSAALWEAVGNNDIYLVRKLLHAGAKVDGIYGGLSNRWVINVLPLAVSTLNIEIVQLLIGADADVNASALYGLLLELWDENDPGFYEDAEVWDGEDEDGEGDEHDEDDGFEDGEDYDKDEYWYINRCIETSGCADYYTVRRTALLSAVCHRKVELVKLVLNAGANVNARPQPSGGWTAIQAAAFTGNTELFQILQDAGANINAPAYSKGGRTALQAAAMNGHTELVQSLLGMGADVNAPAAELRGVTALQAAAIGGQLGIALMLIQAGADPNALPAKRNGRTALTGAAEHGRLDMIQLLLNASADIGDLARAKELAEKNGHVVVAEFLNELGLG